ncbi:PA0069 family radical SAM protein [Lentibacter algarum]|uniref:PA0069 family radical SAM protein n=1 Tax=Lentibacter algarum TaxID=576131 RepID=UPI002091CEC1|nr:PA0069 family radical SAM protein [Lentibacter algarum]
MKISDDRRRGRGVGSNAAGRFERYGREETHDGWEIPEERAGFRTEVSYEQARSLISYNRSPDLPFDRSINPYRGCEHGCVYCFARPSHAYLGLSPGLDFETRLIARQNAAEVLEHELRAKRYEVAPLAVGTNTDAYQPVEKREEVFRKCLKVLQDASHPVAIVTKGTLIERDIDILAPMAAQGLVRVGVSVTTLDATLSRRMEPRVPSPKRRLETIRRLCAAGIPVRVMCSPVVPGLTDAEMERILAAGRDAGATSASWIMLRLPREVSQLWQDWLAEHYPHRAAKVMARLREMHGGKEYDARWHKRMRGEGVYAEAIAARFKLAVRRLGLDEAQPALRCDLFRPPEHTGDQMRLF